MSDSDGELSDEKSTNTATQDSIHQGSTVPIPENWLSKMNTGEQQKIYFRNTSRDGNQTNNVLPPRDEFGTINYIVRPEIQIGSHRADHGDCNYSEENNIDSKKKRNVIVACYNYKTITLSAVLMVFIIAAAIAVVIFVPHKNTNVDVKFATLALNWERMTWSNKTSPFNLTWKEPEQTATFYRLDETKQLICLLENGRYDIDVQLNVESSRSLICVKTSRHDKQEQCHRMGEQYIATSVTLPVAMTLRSGDYIWVSVSVDRLYRSDALNFLHILKHPL